MKHLENYFRNRKEVEDYFGDEVFKFTFMSDNIMTFKSLNPVFLDEELVVFELSFYYESGSSFFAFSSLNKWLDGFQLSEVKCISGETHISSKMFFKQYDDSNSGKD